MDPPPVPTQEDSSQEHSNGQPTIASRSQSFSAKSDDSQTAAEFIDSQLRLEADAREALPYKFEECTKPLGKLRQVLFSCLTCNPPPANLNDPYNAAGVCYSCSIQCHGEHTLVELFNKRDFVCDCGTTRLPKTSPCTLRLNTATNTKGKVHSEEPSAENKYNQNFRNRFCGCECDYEADKQKGTMFQCLGLGTAETGGCGEDWWHPGCLVGLGADWWEKDDRNSTNRKPKNEGLLESVVEVAEDVVPEPDEERPQEPLTEQSAPGTLGTHDDDDPPPPPGFPDEDAFDGFLCYKCIDAHPWIKRYADAPGFLGPVFRRSAAPSPEKDLLGKATDLVMTHLPNLKKRKAEDEEDSDYSVSSKRVKDEVPTASDVTRHTHDLKEPPSKPEESDQCRYKALPDPPPGQFSLFFAPNFRDHLCRCSSCFPLLKPHPQLLEEEENYEPPLSVSDEEAGASTVGSGSIYDRGESALKNVDRVRAIEGVMAYNHLKDKLKPFFQQFAESGKAISAEDIKEHFAKMRGDEQGIKDAAEGAKTADNRKEQSGY